MIMNGFQSLLAQLRTVKQVPLNELVCTLRDLADRNSDLYDEVERLVGAGSNTILPTAVSKARNKVVLAVLLAAVADDIGTLPAERSRTRHLGRLNEACRLLGVKYEDVHGLLEYLPALRPILNSRPGSLIQHP